MAVWMLDMIVGIIVHDGRVGKNVLKLIINTINGVS